MFLGGTKSEKLKLKYVKNRKYTQKDLLNLLNVASSLLLVSLFAVVRYCSTASV